MSSQVVECGSHEELMALHGSYWRMWQATRAQS